MTRITKKHLEWKVDRINEATGNNLAAYTRGEDGKIRGNIGNYHLDWAYGGVKLVQMMNENGGIRVISPHGYGTKRELNVFLTGMLAGLDTN